MIAVDETISRLLPRLQASGPLSEIGNFLINQGTQAYIVGGFLRDRLLGRETADIDIAMAGDALKIAPALAIALGGNYVPLNKENRIARVILASQTSGQWHIDISSFSGSIEHDLKRRDFTINALAVDLSRLYHPQQNSPAEVQVIDPFNGLSDLERGVVRATTDSVFQSDPLRLLRAVRLASELGFTIDGETEGLIKSHCHLIAHVAAERSREELVRLLKITDSEQLWPYLDELGLITALIPELAEAKGVEQPREHTWNVFDHSIKTIAAVDFILRQGGWQYAAEEVLTLTPWSKERGRYFEQPVGASTRRVLTKLAALLHDIAKPQTKGIADNGRTRFLGHASEGAEVAAGVLERLRFSNAEIKLVATIVRHHLRPVQMSNPGELPSQRAIYRYFRDLGDGGIATLFFSLADHLATRGPNLDPANWNGHCRLVDYVISQHLKQEELTTPARLVTGHDLIKTFNLRPGPKIGEVLEAIGEAQASAEIATKEEALALAASILKSSPDSQ